MTNEEINALVTQVKNGNEAAFATLSKQFEPLTRALIKKFSETTVLGRAEREDLLQEASIALYKAAVRYDEAQNRVTFGLYAKICVRNRIISAKRHMERKKRRSSGSVKEDVLEKTAARHDSAAPPEDVPSLLALAKEHLSPFENEALRLRVSGCSYKEIAEKLGRPVKSVDNAVSRARAKLCRLTGRK